MLLKTALRTVTERFGYRILPKSVLPINSRFLKQYSYLTRMYDKISGGEGNIVECGVGKGRTFFGLTSLAQDEGVNRKIFGFDSFEGFPEPTKEDVSYRRPKKGEWSGTSTEDVADILKYGGIHSNFLRNNVVLVKGFFEDTVTSTDVGKIALLHIDVDLYKSYMDVLRGFFPKVVIGGAVLFDEYNLERWPGATKAIDEYFSETGHIVEQDKQSGKYFVIKSVG